MKPNQISVNVKYVELDIHRILSQLDQFTKDTRFLESIRPELQNKYPNYWVAVYKKEVVASASTLKEIIKECITKDVPTSQVALAYLRTKPITVIL